MFFSGFYESIHDSVFDQETEYILEDYPDKEWDDFQFTYDYESYCKNYVRAINSELGMNLEFQELISPREYNFTTDKIICWIKPSDVKKLSSALNSDTMKNLVKERFTSRDGFISFYSPYIEEWKEKKIKNWDAVELGTLLDAWIIESGEDLDNLDFAGMEYCSGNGQYVDYEKMWDEEAELAEKELHQKELEKLDRWNNSVNQW